MATESMRLLWTKTFACGFATMTRAGGATIRPDAVRSSAAASGAAAGGTGRGGEVGVTAAGGGGITAGADCKGGGGVAAGGLGGKSGVVFAAGGDPVRGGADGRGGRLGGVGVGVAAIRAMLGIGLVTAVDQAGGTELEGAGSNWLDVCIGSVVAAETVGRGVGGLLPVAGLSGRGGRLIRSVSRLGGLGSVPSGVASAIVCVFIVISKKCSIAKFAIVTYL